MRHLVRRLHVQVTGHLVSASEGVDVVSLSPALTAAARDLLPGHGFKAKVGLHGGSGPDYDKHQEAPKGTAGAQE